jgi:hypothetical protein
VRWNGNEIAERTGIISQRCRTRITYSQSPFLYLEGCSHNAVSAGFLTLRNGPTQRFSGDHRGSECQKAEFCLLMVNKLSSHNYFDPCDSGNVLILFCALLMPFALEHECSPKIGLFSFDNRRSLVHIQLCLTKRSTGRESFVEHGRIKVLH